MCSPSCRSNLVRLRVVRCWLSFYRARENERDGIAILKKKKEVCLNCLCDACERLSSTKKTHPAVSCTLALFWYGIEDKDSQDQ